MEVLEKMWKDRGLILCLVGLHRWGEPQLFARLDWKDWLWTQKCQRCKHERFGVYEG